MMRTSGLWCVIPAKRRGEAKQRLSPVLNPLQRGLLAEAMLRDVLAAVAGAPGLAGVMVVTSDPVLACIGRESGARILPDEADAGTCRAVEAAATCLGREGARGMLVLPADVPAIGPDDIARLMERHGEGCAVTLVPATHDFGSNALVVSPCDVIAFSFGERSFLKHCGAARAAGIEPSIVPLPGVGLDIDRPDDLAAFHALGSGTHTQVLLDRFARQREPAVASVGFPAPASGTDYVEIAR